ncbi:P-loop containing nucleoside triphosphate hydrolase protein [Rhizophagus clarus]|uniref:P-loop containing nucleoside triphosphate hydrolase protein n=1 Tax=Rhizophagus clarus TaxID=94130 RepID=A0A8H3QS32_9GLOM|nr:P-loop containing nucleoside triphosphate hydrolase protein [Rhizophagus clarus]
MSKEQERFNTQYSNEKEINIGSKGIFDFFKSEFAKSEGSLEIKVHLFELTKLTSLSLTKCPKLTTDNCSLIKLTSLNSLKINNCSEFKKIFDLTALPKLKKLSIVGCSALITFDYSSTGLIDLEISDCSQINHITGFSKLPNLTTLSLNCSNTSIEELSINLCLEIKTLNCSNNHKLTNLDASNCSKLEFLDCTNNKLTILDLRYCSESIDVKYSPSLIIARKKKILIVGRTGGGKSTLANVLTNSNEFKESAYAINETKYFRKKEFEWNEDDKTKDNKEDNFRVVDTIGVGDTKLSTENTLFKIADGILLMPEGISHVLFVINGRFTKEEIDTFNLIKESLFKSDILRYVTIVRSN